MKRKHCFIAVLFMSLTMGAASLSQADFRQINPDYDSVSRIFKDSIAIMHRLLSDANMENEPSCFRLYSTQWESDENNYYLELPLAGADKEDVKMAIEEDYLKIEAKVESALPSKQKDGKPKRSYSYVRLMPHDVQTDKVDAKMKNGLLTVILPKAEKIKPKSINIR